MKVQDGGLHGGGPAPSVEKKEKQNNPETQVIMKTDKWPLYNTTDHPKSYTLHPQAFHDQ